MRLYRSTGPARKSPQCVLLDSSPPWNARQHHCSAFPKDCFCVLSPPLGPIPPHGKDMEDHRHRHRSAWAWHGIACHRMADWATGQDKPADARAVRATFFDLPPSPIRPHSRRLDWTQASLPHRHLHPSFRDAASAGPHQPAPTLSPSVSPAEVEVEVERGQQRGQTQGIKSDNPES